MRASSIGIGALRGVVATLATCLVMLALYACGSSSPTWDPNAGAPTGPSSGGRGGSSSGSGVGMGTPSDEAGSAFATVDATVADAGSDAPAVTVAAPMGHDAGGTVISPDCPGCSFPPMTAQPCTGAPPIKLVYPNDTVLLPPNLNRISVQWTPYGAPFSRFEVDFSQPLGAPNTDWHIVTSCAAQTIDAQSNGPSAGCELVVDPVSWSNLVAANRGGTNPMAITVRGTTDGTCASTSTNTIHVSIAEEDLIGTYYYWKSTVSTAGVGGQIWAKIFGDLNTPEQDVTSPAIQNATCNGCHSLSRDGSRMVVYSDDNDSDDEYSDVAGSYLDMTPLFANPAIEFPGGVTGVRQGGQPPGFSTIHPTASYYVTSNGYPCTGGGGGGGGCGTSNGYPGPVPNNGVSVWTGANGTFVGGVTIGPAGQRPTMPDWSIDGASLVYVQPAGEFTWRQDDAHIFGGSLYTVPYTGMGTFGTPSVFLQSAGENNYYPSYSPDKPMSYIIFNRVDSTGAGSTCANGFCTDDSFSNPAARLMLMGAAAPGSTPIDLEKANGSPVTGKIPFSNSYPRWAPFVQSYHGQKILWFTFSSTRDYGVRVLNHKTGMYQCYPSDAAETPGAAHRQPFVAACQEPQLWMAPLTFTEAQSATMDPSGVAFWIPYQDIATHNHTAQWTWKPNVIQPPVGVPPTCQCSAVYGPCGAANNGCGCCSAQDVCTGSGTCFHPAS